MNMTEIIKSGNPLSNTDIIQVIVDVMEEKGIKVCSCYMDGNDIYGVYINSIFDDDILERYLADSEISPADYWNTIIALVAKAKVYPVLHG